MWNLHPQEDAYFVASNSANGFCSYYEECFDSARIDRVYAIKGGPGTGKSRLIREVAEQVQARGGRVEWIYCSSDPNSLDGALLFLGERCIALLDATAPHVYEPKHVGVREELVDLGVFWDSKKLEAQRDRILSLSQKKAMHYRLVYRYLSAVGEMDAVCRALSEPYIRKEAIDAFAARLMGPLPNQTEYRAYPALFRSVGMCGKVCLDTYFVKAKKLYRIEDCRGSGQYLLAALGRLAVEKGLEVRISHDPVLPHVIDGLMLLESGVCFVLASQKECNVPHRRICMRRFVQVAQMRPLKQQWNYALRMSRAMMAGAAEELEQVRRLHFALEDCYIGAMDFDAKERFTKDFCARLLDLY